MEIITGVERHRHWSVEEKLRLVAECDALGNSVTRVSRQHDISRALLWTWRRQERIAPMVDDLLAWMRENCARLSKKNPVAAAMAYILRRSETFTRFLHDGTDLPDQQCCRTRAPQHRPGSESLTVRRLRSWRPAHRRHLFPHCHRKAQQRRPPSMACRYPHPHQRPVGLSPA